MARVTVEDCIEKIENRFELVMMASQRTRKIGTGAALTIERDNDKNTVISLREIAQETVDTADLKEELTRSHQMMAIYEEEEESIDLMDGEEEWEKMANAPKEGMYADEEVSETAEAAPAAEAAEPSLADLAGNASE